MSLCFVHSTTLSGVCATTTSNMLFNVKFGDHCSTNKHNIHPLGSGGPTASITQTGSDAEMPLIFSSAASFYLKICSLRPHEMRRTPFSRQRFAPMRRVRQPLPQLQRGGGPTLSLASSPDFGRRVSKCAVAELLWFGVVILRVPFHSSPLLAVGELRLLVNSQTKYC